MLKPTDSSPPERGERPIGEIVGQLVDDGKSYAQAEINVAKAIAAAKADALKTPAILLVASLFLLTGAVDALCIGILMALGAVMSPLLAGIVTFLVVGAIAAALAWIGIGKLRDVL